MNPKAEPIPVDLSEGDSNLVGQFPRRVPGRHRSRRGSPGEWPLLFRRPFPTGEWANAPLLPGAIQKEGVPPPAPFPIPCAGPAPGIRPANAPAAIMPLRPCCADLDTWPMSLKKRAMWARWWPNRLIGAVRGRGLAIGVELWRPRNDRAPATEEADRLMYACLARGLSFKVTGGNVVNLTPPLTIAENELDEALDIIDAGLQEIEAGT